MASQEISTPPISVGTDRDSFEFIPMTGWMPSLAVTHVQGVLSPNGASGLKSRMSYQTATTDRSSPDAAAAVWSTETSGDSRIFITQQDISSALTAKYWVRLGVEIKSTTSGTYNQSTIQAIFQISSK